MYFQTKYIVIQQKSVAKMDVNVFFPVTNVMVSKIVMMDQTKKIVVRLTIALSRNCCKVFPLNLNIKNFHWNNVSIYKD